MTYEIIIYNWAQVKGINTFLTKLSHIIYQILCWDCYQVFQGAGTAKTLNTIYDRVGEGLLNLTLCHCTDTGLYDYLVEKAVCCRNLPSGSCSPVENIWLCAMTLR